MNIRILTAGLATTMICACTQGQKERVALQTQIDSVSYAIGVDIGTNFKRGKLDNVNVDAMHMGLQDALDSASTMGPDEVQEVVQRYMMKLQEERNAEEAKKSEANRAAGEKFLAENAKRKGVVTTPSGLQYEVIKMGTGPKPVETDEVTVHYTGMLIDGTKFDSSVDKGAPATRAVTGFIQGWVEALQMMPVGSKWKLYIPSDLGYGPQAHPSGLIPGNSALVFEIELLDIVKK